MFVKENPDRKKNGEESNSILDSPCFLLLLKNFHILFLLNIYILLLFFKYLFLSLLSFLFAPFMPYLLQISPILLSLFRCKTFRVFYFIQRFNYFSLFMESLRHIPKRFPTFYSFYQNSPLYDSFLNVVP